MRLQASTEIDKRPADKLLDMHVLVFGSRAAGCGAGIAAKQKGVKVSPLRPLSTLLEADLNWVRSELDIEKGWL